jgi:two-component system, LytTR family, response regulator
MIRSIIVEDEKSSRELLKNLITKHCEQIIILGMADSVEQGVELIRTNKPDLVFLDISMPDGTGFDLLEKVHGLNFKVIFTTATDKYAVKAIKYSALDYLLKPIDAEELVIAVGKVDNRKDFSNVDNLNFLLQNIKKKDEHYSKITLPTGNAFEIVTIQDIIRCEAEGHYTNFILVNNRKILVSTGLKYYEDLLPENLFIRVHHHHLINLNHVVRYLKTDGGYAVMSDNSQIEISRRKKDTFLQRLQNM